MLLCLSQSPQRKTEGWKRQRVRGRRQKTGDRRQKTGDRRQKTEDRRRLEGWLYLYTSKHLTF
ncbi:MAG TPA: hypothetical protein PK966_08020 [Syntrophorhabdaceae bacterium]|nr:hypothetical protein [Syntrophorhabdaceae bacterium]